MRLLYTDVADGVVASRSFDGIGAWVAALGDAWPVVRGWLRNGEIFEAVKVLRRELLLFLPEAVSLIKDLRAYLIHQGDEQTITAYPDIEVVEE